MALSEKFLCIGAVMILNILLSHGATISRPFINDLYPTTPTEVHQIKPSFFGRSRNLKYIKTNEEKQGENRIIYVKLLKVNYRPKQIKYTDEFEVPTKDSLPKDIFYVKALANGQFSDHRLKVYQIPQFYAINVYKKNEVI